MGKLFNWLTVAGGAVGGVLSYMLGGWDGLLQCLLIFIVIDYASGIAAAAYTGKLSSGKGFKGIIKKAAILLTVCVSAVIEKYLALPVRDMVVTFFVLNDGLSILENLGQIVPLPKGLTKALESLRGEDDE